MRCMSWCVRHCALAHSARRSPCRARRCVWACVMVQPIACRAMVATRCCCGVRPCHALAAARVQEQDAMNDSRASRLVLDALRDPACDAPDDKCAGAAGCAPTESSCARRQARRLPRAARRLTTRSCLWSELCTLRPHVRTCVLQRCATKIASH